MNAKTVRNTLAVLDGKEFETRDELEDAVFPLYGPLTSIFQGEGHRDLVDRLIGAGWIFRTSGKYIVKLPPLEAFVSLPTPTTPAVATPPDVSPNAGPVQEIPTLSVMRFSKVDPTGPERPWIAIKNGATLVASIDQEYIKVVTDLLNLMTS